MFLIGGIYIVESYFISQSDNHIFSLLTGIFRTFTFYVGVVVFKSIIVWFVFYLVPSFLLFLFSSLFELSIFIPFYLFDDLLTIAPYFVILVVELGFMVIIFKLSQSTFRCYCTTSCIIQESSGVSI